MPLMIKTNGALTNNLIDFIFCQVFNISELLSPLLVWHSLCERKKSTRNMKCSETTRMIVLLTFKSPLREETLTILGEGEFCSSGRRASNPVGRRKKNTISNELT
ncbi:hypothetical protein H5410_058468, partial [Solanum commersonii]